MSNNERFTALEMNMAHIEQKFEELNDVIIGQAKEIDILKAKLKIATRKLEEIEDRSQNETDKSLSPTEIAARDKPPHY